MSALLSLAGDISLPSRCKHTCGAGEMSTASFSPWPFLILYPSLSISTRLCSVDERSDIKCVELEPAPPGLHGVHAVIVIIKFYIEEPLEKIERDYEACLCVWERTDRALWKQDFVSGVGDWSERKYLIRSKCFENASHPSIFWWVLSFTHATCKMLL